MNERQKMDPKIKARWVKALRSGKYKQGQGTLRTEDNKFCCLGVLCDLHSRTKQGSKWRGTQYVGGCGVLPITVCAWAGVGKRDPVVGTHTLAEYNDGTEGAPHKTFRGIARLIEKHL